MPCDCNRCYFCLNGITNGLAHAESRKKRKIEVVMANDVRIRMNMCTDVRVTILDNSDYCRMCYRIHRSENPSLGYKAIRKMCSKSRMGCAQCKEPICKSCWENGYDNHENSGIECELMSDK